MKLVLLSGGSGKRLWPLSNDVRSKQFLKMLHAPNGERESMVQRIWRQLEANQLTDDVFISTTNSQGDLIQSQLGANVRMIIEAESRDTFPSIALAATYLYSKIGAELSEVITVMPVDPYVEEEFFSKIKQLEDAINQSGSDLALIGVTPTYPSTKYGYIIPLKEEGQKQSQPYQKVHSFKEKPTEEQAQKLLEHHALWNCGVFAFRLGYLIDLLEEKGLPSQYDKLTEQYGNLPKISFDYEVVEKAGHVVVIPYERDWKDLGTWNTLTEEMDVNLMGRGFLSEDCANTHVINELDLPVAVIGVTDMVIAVSPDGILVSDKAKSHLVKNLMKDMDQRPMYEERRWGWYHVLDYQKMYEKEEVLTKKLHIYAGKNLSYQYHRKRSEVWVIVDGEGEFVLNDQLSLVGPGDVLQIPVGAKHGIKAIKDIEIIEVQMGSELQEEDIIRLFMSWDEMKAFLNRNGKGGSL
ncbi:sugar phosphate nucleotidyltransferase [Brevibacillus choshinensis]|uniref:sugar phosphate nucleotidyltransferase n=1 Tax=Brevibacillus choshinensis TaxID=54911 RepID=UPI002E1FA3AA|nr:sugar phosphate nucleotidyltransferase [Brevibacillus choshinensis]MED4585420.1 sugar phosphate nucleotidyltransferase [Brevibacillus choshinensis]